VVLIHLFLFAVRVFVCGVIFVDFVPDLVGCLVELLLSSVREA